MISYGDLPIVFYEFLFGFHQKFILQFFLGDSSKTPRGFCSEVSPRHSLGIRVVVSSEFFFSPKRSVISQRICPDISPNYPSANLQGPR